MLEIKIKQGRKHVPIFDLPAYLGHDEARREISDSIEGLIAFLDDLGGDPDLEEDDTEDSFGLSLMAHYNSQGPGCPVSDPGSGYGEDYEESGDEHDTTNAEDELITGAALQFTQRGPGCPFSDLANGRMVINGADVDIP